MRLRRWHRLGIILTIVCAIGLFYYVYTRDDELGEDVYYRQTNECRVAERRGLPAEKCYREVERERARVVREKTQQATAVTAGAIVLAWLAAFLGIGLYRWVMAGAPNTLRGEKRESETGAKRDSDPKGDGDAKRDIGDKRRRRERIEPKI